MNEKYTVNNLVKSYLDFFEARGHTVVPSAPLLPEDPTLLFTAAGMVPFKAYYGAPEKAPYARAASVQKCLRAGGKQNDLENVGRTLRHHTFFEMLGNFSFGDYFKKEAIEWGWELSIDVWGLDKDRIWISVFEDDDEAFELWEKHIGVPADRIVRLGRKDNFWGPVGDTGVCGPSSEMHYDTGRPGKDGGPGVDDGDRYIEYWNLVFPQFFFTEKGEYDPLPRPGIDTGLGLERLAFILQDAEDNFHTDEFLPIRNAVAKAVPKKSRDDAALAINAASDHVRALTFAFAEGIMPSNEGRGYVLRRILRRALTKMQPFGVKKPFLAAAVDVVIEKMGPRYPELRTRGELVKEMITAEEKRFLSTLEQGMNRLETIIDGALKKKQKQVSGADVFQLYDTFGFPLELTEELLDDRGLAIDRKGFDTAMEEQRKRARAKSFHSGGATSVEFTALDSDFEAESTEFLGYDELDCPATVVGVRPAPEERASRHGDGKFVEFTTDQTVFYPEGGGQVGDHGTGNFGDTELDIVDAYRVNDHIAHIVRAGDADEVKQALKDDPDGYLHVDRELRFATMRNHTATHLLHAALREVLGDHVAQAGSLVAPDRLRFDFHHFQAMKPEEVADVERIVNDAVLDDLEVSAANVAYQDAIDAGAMALFGEKYGDVVRMVTIEDVSRELCGGTHLNTTGQIGSFIIRQEAAVGSGIRRVEALTGKGALDFAKKVIDERNTLASLLKVAPEDLERRVRALLEEADTLQKQMKKQDAKRAQEEAGDALAGAVKVGPLNYVATHVDAADVSALRNYGDALRGKLGDGVALICQNTSDKPVCLIVVSDEAIQQHGVRANDLAQRVRDALPFRGGGKPHMAQVGLGTREDFDTLRDFIKAALEVLL